MWVARPRPDGPRLVNVMDDDYKDWQDFDIKVVRNHENVVSIWPADKENPLGWFDVGVSGQKDHCLAWIKEHCTADCKYLGDLPVSLDASGAA